MRAETIELKQEIDKHLQVIADQKTAIQTLTKTVDALHLKLSDVEKELADSE